MDLPTRKGILFRGYIIIHMQVFDHFQKKLQPKSKNFGHFSGGHISESFQNLKNLRLPACFLGETTLYTKFRRNPSRGGDVGWVISQRIPLIKAGTSLIFYSQYLDLCLRAQNNSRISSCFHRFKKVKRSRSFLDKCEKTSYSKHYLSFVMHVSQIEMVLNTTKYMYHHILLVITLSINSK